MCSASLYAIETLIHYSMNSTMDKTHNGIFAGLSQTFNFPCKRAVYLFSLFDLIMKSQAAKENAIL